MSYYLYNNNLYYQKPTPILLSSYNPGIYDAHPAYLNNNNNINYLNTINNTNKTVISSKPPFINNNHNLNNYLINLPTSINVNANNINNLNLTNYVNPINYNSNKNENRKRNHTFANAKKITPRQNNIEYNNNNNINLYKNSHNKLNSNNQLNAGNNLNKKNILINQSRNNNINRIKRSINIDPNIDVDNQYRHNNVQNNNNIITSGYNNINKAVVENNLTNPSKNINNNKMIAVVENNLIPNKNMNNINQNAIKEIDLGGTKNNIQNNKNIPNENNFATIKKISEASSNVLPTSSEMKKRVLSIDDYKNIIYKEVGIINLGNTCFINSCLQVLIHCKLFIYNFFNKQQLINKNNTPISYAFYELCKDMMQILDQQENKYIDISNFKKEFGSKHSTFDGYLQNDSQEFFRVLLEDISTELNEASNKTIYRALTNSDIKKTKQFRDIEFDKNFSEREKSIVTDIFYAQLIATFTCQCNHKTYSFQKILDFPLLLPENKPNVDIYDLLINYFQSEVIDFETKCEKCQRKQKHRKDTKISRPPKLLILSFQRIDSVTQKKNECVVTFPKILKMNKFIEEGIGNDINPIYELFAVINHQGTVDFGHYFSYIKFNHKEDWYEFNDSSVKPIAKNIESFPYAYALFYIKI